jgi:hypothetical protein
MAALLCLAAPLEAQQTRPETGAATLVGFVVDRLTTDGLISALVEIPALQRRAATDDRGRFIMTGLPLGTHRIVVRHLGYADYGQDVRLESDSTLVTIVLGAAPILLEGIGVEAYRFGETLERRRLEAGVSSRAIGRTVLQNAASADAVQVLRHAGVDARGCRVAVRGDWIVPIVFIDDAPALNGLADLETYFADELYRIEVFAAGREIRVYTSSYVDHMGRRNRTPPVLNVGQAPLGRGSC